MRMGIGNTIGGVALSDSLRPVVESLEPDMFASIFS